MKSSTKKTPWAFILLAMSIYSVLFGAYIVTLQATSDQVSYCSREEHLPDTVKPIDIIGGGRYFELFPLGYRCRVVVGDDELTVVTKPNWTVSVLVYGGIAGTVVGAVGTAVFVRRLVRRVND